jgi:hypothetical protein
MKETVSKAERALKQIQEGNKRSLHFFQMMINKL